VKLLSYNVSLILFSPFIRTFGEYICDSFVYEHSGKSESSNPLKLLKHPKKRLIVLQKIRFKKSFRTPPVRSVLSQ